MIWAELPDPIDHRHNRQEWAAAGGAALDPTGAGDAFAGGFLAPIARGSDWEVALQQGVVSASYAIADWGARGLLDADAEQAQQRLQSWFGARARS